MLAILTLADIRLNDQIVTVRNDELSIAKVIDRLVMPRRLTKRQQARIGQFLAEFAPCEYAFKLTAMNNEVGIYRADIEQALIKGGWTLSPNNPYGYTNDVQEGLSINLLQTPDHAQNSNPIKAPNAATLLEEAFGLAGVRTDASGSGSGIGVTKDLITISIGPERRDSFQLEKPDTF